MKKLALLIMSLTCVLLLSSCNKMIFESNGDGTCSLKSSIGFLEKEIVIPSESPKGDTVTEISSKAFRYCKGFTSVTIPDSVTSIGSYAFYKCQGLTSVTIPDSVLSIGDEAFYGCLSLTSVTIPDSVLSIGKFAFMRCSGLISITIPDSVLSIGARAFDGCFSLTSVTIGNGVTSIGDWAFEGCSGLTSVTIGNGVTSIGKYAFYDCQSLTSVHITDLAKWCGISFDSYSSNPLYYAENLYLNGNLVTELRIPAGVSSIGNYAFWDCRGLTSVTIPDSVLSIGYDAFYNCSGLTSIHITDLAKWCGISFDNYMSNPLYCAENLYLNGNLVTELTIPDGVSSIGNYAFSYCRGLTSVTIPDSVSSIGKYAFWDCRGLTTVYYAGTEAEWSKISIDSDNSNLTSATRYYYSETEPTAAGNYWHYDENGEVVVW